jgi:hypothetical protein
VFQIRDVHPESESKIFHSGSRIWIRAVSDTDLAIYPANIKAGYLISGNVGYRILDPGGKKAPDPGSGSATLNLLHQDAISAPQKVQYSC